MMMMVSTFITGPLCFSPPTQAFISFVLISCRPVFFLLPPKCINDEAWLTVHWFQGLKIRDTMLQFMVISLQSSLFLMTHSGVAVELFACVYTLSLWVCHTSLPNVHLCFPFSKLHTVQNLTVHFSMWEEKWKKY